MAHNPNADRVTIILDIYDTPTRQVLLFSHVKLGNCGLESLNTASRLFSSKWDLNSGLSSALATETARQTS